MEYVADFSGIPNELKQFADDRSMSLEDSNNKPHIHSGCHIHACPALVPFASASTKHSPPMRVFVRKVVSRYPVSASR